MILSVLKNNRLARITAIITSFSILVCLIVGIMIVRLSNKIQDTKVSIKQNSLNAYKIEKLLTDYQKVDVKNLWAIETKKEILKKENVVDLIELMERIALEKKVVPLTSIEGSTDLANLSDNITYNINLQASENKMRQYLIALENLPYVSQITDFQSNLSINNSEILKLIKEKKMQDKLEKSEQLYALRLKVFLE